MKAIVFERVGVPLEVLELRDVPIPEVGPGQALVEMVAASINPGDFLFIQALYPDPKKPIFPRQIAGGHGTGVVIRVGEGVDIPPGTRVAFSHKDAWAEYASLPAEWLIPLPPDYPTEKAAQILNLITAWDLVEEARVEAGQWLVLTAGNSTISTMVTQLARRRGIQVLSIVRQAQPGLDLKSLGSTEVIELARHPEGVRDRVIEITRGNGPGAVIDCVGGALVGQLMRSFTGFGGQVVIYGGFSPSMFELHNLEVLMKGLTIKPYVYCYFFNPPGPQDAARLRQIIEEAGRPDFAVRIAGTHALDDFAAAVRATVERSELGKRLLVMR
jgi:NADPH2:quinone reductase